MGKNPPVISGTKEWAVANVNNTKGCVHGCHYCYARSRAMRFKQIERVEDWTTMEVRTVRPRKLYPGTVMFPTTHDIVEQNLEACIETLTSLLKVGNHVLIVSKPHAEVIEKLLPALAEWKDHILFRFTIGTLEPGVIALWEPGAPHPMNRLTALIKATKAGFLTSISMEPMLHPTTAANDARFLYNTIRMNTPLGEPDPRQTVWLGRMNQISRRVVGVPKEVIEKLDHDQRVAVIWEIYNDLKMEPWVRWKESIKKIVGLPLETEAGTDR